jgi:serine O-acetyltransferase
MGGVRSFLDAWRDNGFAGRRLRQNLFATLNAPRLLPHLLLMRLKHDARLRADFESFATNCIHYGDTERGKQAGAREFLILMATFPEFRNVFYYRMGLLGRLVRFLAPPMDSIYLPTPDIGPGLFLHHGFATIVSARRVGANCWINQQVTIGSDASGNPEIGDNVHVHCGAKVLGQISVGDNVVIGANAVVVKNVPPNCTVVGVPARIVRRNGQRVDEKL